MVIETPSSCGWLRKRQLNQVNHHKSFHNLQQDRRRRRHRQSSTTETDGEQQRRSRSPSPSTPSKTFSDRYHPSKQQQQQQQPQQPHRRTPLSPCSFLPSLKRPPAMMQSSSSKSSGASTSSAASHGRPDDGNDRDDDTLVIRPSHRAAAPPRRAMMLPSSSSRMRPNDDDNNMTAKKNAFASFFRERFEFAVDRVARWNDDAMRRSARYERVFHRWTKPFASLCWSVLGKITSRIVSVNKCTCRQMILLLSLILIWSLSYVYFVKLPVWEYEEEWTRWEEGMQRSVANLIPPLPPNTFDTMASSPPDQLEKFPYLNQRHGQLTGKVGSMIAIEASEFVVPIPDYELMGTTRGKLARQLREHAAESCRQHHRSRTSDWKHSLPVIGITVATDTPENRYLRRLLHTIDLATVGSIVVTWYDEQTEAQLLGEEMVGLSHEVIERALQEFIIRRGFTRLSREEGSAVDATNIAGDGNFDDFIHETSPRDIPPSHTPLANPTSLKLMSRIATSVQQFCIFDHDWDKEHKVTETDSSFKPICRNELLILRFPTNLGCSSGVNNPLFTHPAAPHWLIANYDVAYPPGVLAAMGKELKNTKMQKPDLAVHTYGYIYGRGKLENPWSNFVMTSCAVANVGVWDEDIFPAYYEDDDFRDRIRYIMGKWKGVIGDPDRHRDAPQYFMDDTELIRYQTERHVSVAHGPLTADTYLSGTHETMKKVQDEEEEAPKRGILQLLWLWLHPPPEKPQNPFHYESHRWNVVKEVSDAKGFFRCKHGALPDAGEHGEDAVRYFGWHERFLLPFVNRTRVSRVREALLHQPNEMSQDAILGSSHSSDKPSPWSIWSFNATRRDCVHKAANIILSMPPSEERTNLTQEYRSLCSVC